jgi:hypothetical protein
MGFMDKAKKMAEQAQQKLDDVQKNFNEGQGSGGQQEGGPAVEYDKHGRPVNAPASAEAPPAPQPSAPAAGDPLADPAPSPVAGAPATPAPGAPEAPAPSAHPTPDPAAPGAAGTSEPAKVEGDPLLADEPGSRQGADAERDAAAKPPSGGAPGMTSGDPLG